MDGLHVIAVFDNTQKVMGETRLVSRLEYDNVYFFLAFDRLLGVGNIGSVLFNMEILLFSMINFSEQHNVCVCFPCYIRHRDWAEFPITRDSCQMMPKIMCSYRKTWHKAFTLSLYTFNLLMCICFTIWLKYRQASDNGLPDHLMFQE